MSASGRKNAALKPFTLAHFREYASRLVFEDNETHPPEDWQLAIAGDVFKGYTEVWEITPEANGKSTFIAQLALYGADYSPEPWIPVGAAAAQQAKIIYTQAEGFVHRTPGMPGRFKCLGGYKLIRSKRNGGVGIQIYAHDPKTGDGVIPYPFAILDELHRHPDLRLYSLWLGKLRKRGGQLLAASTAGEPYSPFENLRKQVRDRATKRKRDGAYLRAEGGGLVLHEYMVQREEDCSDMERVKEANPFSGVTVAGLAQQYDSPTRDDGDWKRLKCNRPARSSESAITDKEWDDSQVPASEWDNAQIIDIGLDWAPKWDTTALVPLWKGPKYRLIGPPKILIPPRDGTFLHPDEVKAAMYDLGAGRTIATVVMDMSRAQDIASWIEDELGLTVIEWGTSNRFAVEDFNSVMEGLRNGTLKHTGDPGLRVHAMNAIARRLPGGDYRFERPNESRGSIAQQDRRVIDALTATGMVVSFSNRQPERESIYASRGVAVAELPKGQPDLGLLDFFARKKAVSASPAVLEAAADRRVSFMPLIATPSEAFNPRIRDAFVEVQSGTYGWIYAHQPAVRTVIDYIARNAAQLGLSLYERVGDNDRKEVGDHPAAESLRYPNPRQRTRALVYNLAIEWLIFDNAYALIVEGEAGRVQLLPVPAPRVGVLGPENYSVDAYRIWRRDGTWFDWPTESMLHWAGFDPDDPRRGVSRLETLRQLLAEDRASQAANTEVLQSGLLKPGYLKRPLDAPPLDVADATRIVEDWQAAIKAPGRRTAMLEEGTEFEDFGITPRDAEMLEGRRFTREEVSAIYGMDTCPPENAEDRQIFFSDVLQPLMRLFCETLDRSVLEQQYGLTDHYFQAGLDEQMESEKLKALTAASGRPVLLTDEARAALDLPPVEGGDELVTPANVIVGSNPKPSPMVMPIQDPNKPEQDGSFRQEALTNGHTKQLEVTNEPRRDADRRRQMRYIDEMKALLARHYARQRKTLVSPTANKAAGDAALWLRWTEELGRDLVKLLKSITDREANIYVSRLGGVDFDMREVDHYLTAMAEGTADGINGATQRDIADAGTEEAFNRADMRTEVAATGIGTRATVFARKEAGRQAPNPEQRLKIWIANSERHQDLDGVTVPLEGDWGGIVPGSEPNCSCAMEVV